MRPLADDPKARPYLPGRSPAWLLLVLAAAVVLPQPATAAKPSSTEEELGKLARMLLDTGDIDRVNQTITQGTYPEIATALKAGVVSLTAKSGTPVQYRHAIDRHPPFGQRLEAPYREAILPPARQEIQGLISGLLLGKSQDVKAPTALAPLGRFLWRYDVPELGVEVRSWCFVYEKLLPAFASGQPASAERRLAVLKNLMADGDIFWRDDVQAWLDRSASQLTDPLVPAQFLGGPEAGSPRELLLDLLDRLRKKNRSAPGFAKALWGLASRALELADGKAEVGVAMADFTRDRLVWLDKGLGGGRIDVDLRRLAMARTGRPTPLLADFLLRRLGRDPALDATALETQGCHAILPVLLAIQPGNGFDEAVIGALAGRAGRIADAPSLATFLKECPVGNTIPRVKIVYAGRLEMLETAALKAVKAKAQLSASVRSVSRMKREPDTKCARYTSTRQPDVCVRCTVQDQEWTKGYGSGGIFGSSYGYKKVLKTGYRENVCNGDAGPVVHCARWEARSTTECAKWVPSFRLIRSYDDKATIKAMGRNPFDVPIRISFEFDASGGIPNSFLPPTSLDVGAGESWKVAVSESTIGRDPGEAYRLTKYRISGVRFLLSGE